MLCRRGALGNAAAAWQLFPVKREIELGEVPSETFATWWHPSDALDQFIALGDDEARDAVLAMLSDGLIQAAAERLVIGGRDLGLSAIPREIWPFVRGFGFWSTSRFRVSVSAKDQDDHSVSAYGIRLDPEAVVRLAPPRPAPRGPIDLALFDLVPSPAPERHAARRGGRPAGTNGEPIARITMRLLAMPTAAIASYKVEALASDLIAEYRELGLNPPHEDNAKRDASGILRALRDRGET